MPNFLFENKERSLGARVICGVDEAGRGSWAGPVVAAAAILDYPLLPIGLLNSINDSKRLSLKKREEIYSSLVELVCYGVGISSVSEIDQINILQATMLAMSRAVLELKREIDIALIDGNRSPIIPGVEAKCIVKGDEKSISIAAASIIAKVTRDRIMVGLGKKFKEFGWERNAGYGTSEHKDALLYFGPTPEHRKSFAPVREMLGD